MNAWLLILVMAVVTFAIRALPFIILRRNTPAYISYLGKVLPAAVIGMLVVYCIKDVEVRAFPYGIPELLSIICVILIHIWKRNTVLSIFGGTVIYMAVLNMINMI